MTNRVTPFMVERSSADTERVLDAYAEATRIVASAQLVRRFQLRVAEERQAAPASWLSSVAPGWALDAWREVKGAHRTAFGRHVTFALRLQSLALVLITVLALGVLVGGVGAALVSVMEGPGQGMDVPGRVIDASPSTTPPPTSPAPALPSRTSSTPTPTAEPTAKVTALAQRRPGRAGRHADHRPSRARTERRPGASSPGAAGSGCPVPSVHAGLTDEPTTLRTWSPLRVCID